MFCQIIQLIFRYYWYSLVCLLQHSVMNTPAGKGTAHNKTIDKGAGLNVTVDVEVS